eukprot:CAMPEP_0197269904 /NCGR_PEP_ID=MMETSP1432-20130617/6328_1 /TAXON_ID=44447 /ORGANISM="Pseudo-nitzschia delicatissima, Strain UNC1205" /LENGTH=130 /DNA_ID=CAMNT_0042735135 /DNA_START=178 /DNA_END=570 /DNA_ORIENTATION=+
MSDDKKDPQEQLKELIKIGVDATNSGLRVAQTVLQNFKEPLSSTIQSLEDNSSVTVENAKTLYVKRKQYAPEIMVSTAVLTGGYSWLRRGRIAGILGAAVGTGVAYSVVYGEFPVDVEKLQNVIFGKSDK